MRGSFTYMFLKVYIFSLSIWAIMHFSNGGKNLERLRERQEVIWANRSIDDEFNASWFTRLEAMNKTNCPIVLSCINLVFTIFESKWAMSSPVWSERQVIIAEWFRQITFCRSPLFSTRLENVPAEKVAVCIWISELAFQYGHNNIL